MPLQIQTMTLMMMVMKRLNSGGWQVQSYAAPLLLFAPSAHLQRKRVFPLLALLASFNGDHLATLLRVVRVPLPFGS